MRSSILTVGRLLVILISFSIYTPLLPQEISSSRTASDALRNFSFLMPSPFENNSAGEKKGLLKLFTAPVIDMQTIRSAAKRHESLSRKRLLANLKHLRSTYCRLETAERYQFLDEAMEIKSIQTERARSTNHRFGNMARRYISDQGVGLNRNRDRRPLYPSEMKQLFSRWASAVELSRDRILIVSASYDGLFARMREELHNGVDYPKDADSMKRCLEEPFESAGEYPILNESKMYLPYYIALGRFYEAMPPYFRIQWANWLEQIRNSR